AHAEEFTSDMGAKAALIALEKAGVLATDVDLIICATLTPDYTFPSTAALLQKELGAINAAAFDVQAACSGFIYGLSIAKAYVTSGIYKNILLVASEKLSSIVNYKDRNTCVLFGDGACAALIANEGPGLVVGETSLGADGEQASLLMLPAGGARHPASLETVEKEMHFIFMDGKETFKHAVRRMEAAAKEVLEKSGLKEAEISWLIPHQANIRIIDAMAKRFSVPDERVYKTVHKYGNTSASSIGIALFDLMNEGVVNKGEHLLLVAFGAGLTWGATILTATEE
ncbi:MAG: beta-ketoacyl-ACP synthase III, partial [Chlamydiota bacterium]